MYKLYDSKSSYLCYSYSGVQNVLTIRVTLRLSYKGKGLLMLHEYLGIRVVQRFSFLCCVVSCSSTSFVLCVQCCQCLWIVHCSFYLRFSLTFILIREVNFNYSKTNVFFHNICTTTLREIYLHNFREQIELF